jgi:hypothetical protein
VTSSKIPTPRRVGNSNGHSRALKLARKAVTELCDDPEALAMVVSLVEMLAVRSRRRRR